MTEQDLPAEAALLEKKVWDALAEVPDPEIPTVSVVELGMITGIDITHPPLLSVTMTPTFSGCPAVNHIRDGIKDKLREFFPDHVVEVKVDFETQWNSNRITEEGLRKLKAFGLAPPKRYEGGFEIADIAEVHCPYCGSENTTMHSSFGPTLCRAVHYCFNCLQGFEQFKPL